MTGERSEAAVQRIETALARIARVADSPAQAAGSTAGIAPPAGAAPNVLALIDRHESLRESVAQALAELDAVIAEIEQ